MQILTIAAVLSTLAVGLPEAAALANAGAPAGTAECAVLPRPTLRIRLVIEPDVPQDLRALVESAVATVWRGEGLTIDWQPARSPESSERSTHFWVRLTTRLLGQKWNEREQTLGAVRFLGDLPHHDVLVSWTAVRAWARNERDRQFRPIFVGVSPDASLEFGGFEALARRAVALAAAHEVGHFVLASKTHDTTGLMRRDLMPGTVAAVEHADLSLSIRSRRRLQDRLAQGAACPTTVALDR